MDDPRFLILYTILAGIALASLRKALRDPKADAIPIVGSSGFLSSYRDALASLGDASPLIQRGYDQYPEGVFRFARPFGWKYVVCGPKLVKEVGAAPEHILSFRDGLEDLLPTKQVLDPKIAENPYHHHTIRTNLTRNLHARFPDVRDEIVCAFNDVLRVEGPEWQTVTVLPMIMAVVARVSNRLFVGLPLCRDKVYLRNNVEFALDVIRSARRVALFPYFLRPVVAPFITHKTKCFATAIKLLGPTVQERLEKERELGPEWAGKPNDFISCLLESADEESRTTPDLVLRILATNFAAIHTSSMAFTHALFDLAAYPEHLLPLREEVERVMQAEGGHWSKAALNGMVLVDSFLRESQRMNNSGPVSMNRKVMAKEGFHLSDGTIIPHGAIVCVAAQATHRDAAKFDNPTKFDGFRFARERSEHAAKHEEDSVFKRQMISTSVDHLPFGTGKHACPGRFFAATELKAMLAHLVLNYDVKAEVEGMRPKDMVSFNSSVAPNPVGRVCIRKRV
ncbi:cytochrome P450 [Mycena filopes]|nr:cytochrome P450 [Mycena filopes]